MHVAEGADFGWRLQIGARCCRPDLARGAVAGELPGKVPPMLKTGRGSPAGPAHLQRHANSPSKYRGLLYYPDVFRKLVRAYKVAPDGSTFEVTHEFEFLKSDDPLFRPCQMVTGPDGAIYVCDWRTDSGGAGRLWGDGKHGRIYRITWAGTKDTPAIPLRGLDSWAKLLKLPTDKLIEKLDAADFTDRVEARKELVRRGPEASDAVLKAIQRWQVRVQWKARCPRRAASTLVAGGGELFRSLLSDPSEDLRRLAIEGLAMYGPPKNKRNHEAVLSLVVDRNPAVMAHAVLAIARIGAEGSTDVALAR